MSLSVKKIILMFSLISVGFPAHISAGWSDFKSTTTGTLSAVVASFCYFKVMKGVQRKHEKVVKVAQSNDPIAKSEHPIRESKYPIGRSILDTPICNWRGFPKGRANNNASAAAPVAVRADDGGPAQEVVGNAAAATPSLLKPQIEPQKQPGGQQQQVINRSSVDGAASAPRQKVTHVQVAHVQAPVRRQVHEIVGDPSSYAFDQLYDLEDVRLDKRVDTKKFGLGRDIPCGHISCGDYLGDDGGAHRCENGSSSMEGSGSLKGNWDIVDNCCFRPFIFERDGNGDSELRQKAVVYVGSKGEHDIFERDASWRNAAVAGNLKKLCSILGATHDCDVDLLHIPYLDDYQDEDWNRLGRFMMRYNQPQRLNLSGAWVIADGNGREGAKQLRRFFKDQNSARSSIARTIHFKSKSDAAENKEDA